MPNVYCSMNKIPNAVGRSAYLGDKDRQEEIFIHESHMKMSWDFYSAYEREHSNSDKENNEARELIIALPNDLYFEKEHCSEICNEIANRLIGPNHDYEFAVHWNHNRTNLHAHILFSERSVRENLEPKRYRKDIWQDKDTHKLVKANAANSELVHKKGEVMLDRNGNVRYESDSVTIKDTKFKTRAFIQQKNLLIKDLLNEHGFQLDVQTYDSPYLSQKKIGKGSNSEYRQKVTEWNEAVRKYNANVRDHIELNENIRPQYVQMKYDILKDVHDFNVEEKKITNRALELVQDMARNIEMIVVKVKQRIKESAIYQQLNDYWQSAKEQFSDLFSNNEEIAKKNALYEQRLGHLEEVNEMMDERKSNLRNEYQKEIGEEKGYDLSL